MSCRSSTPYNCPWCSAPSGYWGPIRLKDMSTSHLRNALSYAGLFKRAQIRAELAERARRSGSKQREYGCKRVLREFVRTYWRVSLTTSGGLCVRQIMYDERPKRSWFRGWFRGDTYRDMAVHITRVSVYRWRHP